MPDAKPVQYRVVDRLEAAAGDERSRVIEGLAARPARIEPKYFYDELGCALYGAICRLPEYYPTRTETALFRAHRSDIADAIGRNRQFVDLGAGDCCKAEGWLPFVAPARYVAVDIAAAEIESALARMAPEFPDVEMIGVVADFTRGLPLEGILDSRPCTFFYPGSSIGNFTPEEARAFLAKVRAQCASRPGSGLLIGVDGKKEKARLDAAYDDALGVTAAFNRNALVHLNRRFGFDFPLDAFVHRGFYSEERGRIEMHLEATREVVVRLGGTERRFAPGERIHTENSYKYRADEFAALLGQAGFASVRRWQSDDGGYFVFYAS
ncbi:MAG TPA: L-histidine N(alpha)-methyltransferase [Usitatibacter sp.]|nr:L-histidine N(alpha)-methyltransferase [Usitatibacter sp.]